MKVSNINSVQDLSKYVTEVIESKSSSIEDQGLIERINSLGAGINQLSSSDCVEMYQCLSKIKSFSVLGSGSKNAVEGYLHSLNGRMKALSSGLSGLQENRVDFDEAKKRLTNDPKNFISSDQFAEFISSVQDKEKRLEIALLASEFVSQYIQLFDFNPNDSQERQMLFAIAKQAAEKDANFLEHFDLFGLDYQSYQDDEHVIEIEGILNAKGKKVVAEVSNLNKIVFLPEENFTPINKISNQEKSYEAVGSLGKLWDLVEDISENEDKYHVFEFREGINLEKARTDLFPAIEHGPEYVKRLILGQFKERFELLGIKIFEQNGKELLQLPDRETLEKNWKKLQELYPNTQDLKIRPSDGIASSEDFVAAFQRGEIILSSGIEFIHDFQVHLIPMFSHFFNEQQNYENRIELLNRDINRLNKNYQLNIPTLNASCSLNDFNLAIDRVVEEIEEIKINEHLKEFIKERVLTIKGRSYYISHKIEESKKYFLYNDAESPYYFLFQGIMTDVFTAQDELMNYSNYFLFSKKSTNYFRMSTIDRLLSLDKRWGVYINKEVTQKSFSQEMTPNKIKDQYMNKLNDRNRQVIIHGEVDYENIMDKGDLLVIGTPLFLLEPVVKRSTIEKVTICGYQEELNPSFLKFIDRIKTLDLSEAIISHSDLRIIKKYIEENCPLVNIIEPLG